MKTREHERLVMKQFLRRQTKHPQRIARDVGETAAADGRHAELEHRPRHRLRDVVQPLFGRACAGFGLADVGHLHDRADQA